MPGNPNDSDLTKFLRTGEIKVGDVAVSPDPRGFDMRILRDARSDPKAFAELFQCQPPMDWSEMSREMSAEEAKRITERMMRYLNYTTTHWKVNMSQPMTPSTEKLEISLTNGMTITANLDEFMGLPPVQARVLKATDPLDAEIRRLNDETAKAHEAINQTRRLRAGEGISQRVAALCKAWSEQQQLIENTTDILSFFPYRGNLLERVQTIVSLYSNANNSLNGYNELRNYSDLFSRSRRLRDLWIEGERKNQQLDKRVKALEAENEALKTRIGEQDPSKFIATLEMLHDALDEAKAGTRNDAAVVRLGELVERDFGKLAQLEAHKAENDRLKAAVAEAEKKVRIADNNAACAEIQSKYWYKAYSAVSDAIYAAGFGFVNSLEPTKVINTLVKDRDEARDLAKTQEAELKEIKKALGEAGYTAPEQFSWTKAGCVRELGSKLQSSLGASEYALHALPVDFRKSDKTLTQNITDLVADYTRIKDEWLRLKEWKTSLEFTAVTAVTDIEGRCSALDSYRSACSAARKALPAEFNDNRASIADCIAVLADSQKRAIVSLKEVAEVIPTGFRREGKTLAGNVKDIVDHSDWACRELNALREKAKKIEEGATMLESVAWGIYHAIGREIGMKKVTEPMYLNVAVKEKLDHWKKQVGYLKTSQTDLRQTVNTLRAEIAKLKVSSKLATVIDDFYKNERATVIPVSGTD